MADHFADSSVLVVATVRKADMHAHMSGPDGPNMIGGSSVYPMIQNRGQSHSAVEQGN